MAGLGFGALVVGLALAVYVAFASLLAARRGSPELGASARNGTIAVAAMLSLAAAMLLAAFLSHDFSLTYVAENSPPAEASLVYTFTAFYAGNAGFLLLWVWLLSLCSVLVLLTNRNKHQELIPYVTAILALIEVFFLGLVIYSSNPFQTQPYIPGAVGGPSPLLQNPGMVIHPPTLLGGYVGFTVPFAFALAALITRKLSDEWLRSIRTWALVGWLLLTVGNLAGAQWAYGVLGWGGYWGWDPVENSSLIPWLTGTAFIHSALAQKRNGMMKPWNMVLIIITFVLTIFGTYLTRTDLSEVHGFSDESHLGFFFLGFIGLTLLVSLGYLFDRLPDLSGEEESDSFLSRETMFQLNNLLLVGAAFAVFSGTVFPLFSRVIQGVKVAVPASFYNIVAGPILLGVVALLGLCVLIGWRHTGWRKLLRRLLYPAIMALAVGLLLSLLDIVRWLAVPLFFFCGLVFFTIAFEWFREVRARRRAQKVGYWQAFSGLMEANRPRYGAYIVHLGIALLLTGIMGSSLLKTESEATLTPGQSMNAGQYTLRYEKLDTYTTPSRQTVAARLSVFDGGKPIGELRPQRFLWVSWDKWFAQVDIRLGLKQDLYAILYDSQGTTATFVIFVNPLVNWIWIGGFVLIIGTVVALLPERRRKSQPVSIERDSK